MELLDPDVALLWWTPGDWDCHGKAHVPALLTDRAAAGPPAEVDLTGLDASTILVQRRRAVFDGPEAGLQAATLIRLRNGLVVQMVQYRSREGALASFASPTT